MDYCVKDGAVAAEWGRPSPHGDVDGTVVDAAALAGDAPSRRALVEADPGRFERRGGNLLKMYEILRGEPPTREGLTVEVAWGESGTGKSTWAFGEAGDDYYVWTPSETGCWFDGYDGQKTLILDDFDGSCMGYRLFLRVCDRWPLRVWVKHGMEHARWVKVLITSNLDPSNWYPSSAFGPISRRMTIVREFPLFSTRSNG